MLVLTRKKGESIFIGQDITVTFLEQKGDRISLGITAPNEVRISRSGQAPPAPCTEKTLDETPGTCLD